MRVRLLGEDLVAFRDTKGAVGLLQNNCPHRGASLFFGRNEESGLRCVYHGWKFDADGTCVDMPNEPAESDFKHKVNARPRIRLSERGGVVWAYLGPKSLHRRPPGAGVDARPRVATASSPSASSTATTSRTSKAKWTPATSRSCTVATPPPTRLGSARTTTASTCRITWRATGRHAFSSCRRTTASPSERAATPSPTRTTGASPSS